MYPFPLVAICQATHTAHYAEHVIVGGINIHRGRGVNTDGVVGDSEDEGGVVNTG